MPACLQVKGTVCLSIYLHIIQEFYFQFSRGIHIKTHGCLALASIYFNCHKQDNYRIFTTTKGCNKFLTFSAMEYPSMNYFYQKFNDYCRYKKG